MSASMNVHFGSFHDPIMCYLAGPLKAEMAFQASKELSKHRPGACIRCGTESACAVQCKKHPERDAHCNAGQGDEQVPFYWGDHFESCLEMYEVGKHCFLGSKTFCHQFMLAQMQQQQQ